MLPKELDSYLLNPNTFEDSQITYSPSQVVSFRDQQNQRFLVLYQMFFLLQSQQNQIKSNFNQMKSELDSQPIAKAAEVGIRSGIQLIISLIREASEAKKELRDETLNFLNELFAEVEPLSLWGTTKIDIILDKSLHCVADFLEELIQKQDISMDSKKKALKVLFKLGLLRGSLPNLLSVVSLLQKQHLSLDLGQEIDLLKSATPQLDF